MKILRILRVTLGRVQAICLFIVLPAGLIVGMGAVVVDKLFGQSESLDQVILWCLGACVVSGLLLWLLPRLVRGLEYLSSLTLPIRSAGTPSGLHVLYLRPFSLDARTAGGYLSFEEILLDRIRTRVLAVSNPGAKENTFVGARRVKLPSQTTGAANWQSHVATMVREAKVILAVFDDSLGLREELAILTGEEALSKTALVLPFVDHWQWGAALEALPDEIMVDCLRLCPPSASTVADLKQTLRRLYLPDVNQVSRKSGMFSDFRLALQRAREQRARERPGGPIDPVKRLVDAGCPMQMLLMLHALTERGVSGMTFGRRFRLWSRPALMTKERSNRSGLRDLLGDGLLSSVANLYQMVLFDSSGMRWGRELAQMTALMLEHLSNPAT